MGTFLSSCAVCLLPLPMCHFDLFLPRPALPPPPILKSICVFATTAQFAHVYINRGIPPAWQDGY